MRDAKFDRALDAASDTEEALRVEAIYYRAVSHLYCTGGYAGQI